MPEENDNDTIIAIASALRKAMGGDRECSIHFPSVEGNWELPAGSVAKHLDAAAEHARMEITLRGSIRATLRRKQAEIVRG